MQDDPQIETLSQSVIDRLLPTPSRTVAEIEASYPKRQLPEGALVTRIAPSPTGFMHLGVIYASLIAERLAHQSDGVFFLRIEDTDRKREVEGAREFITKSLSDFMISPDEGPESGDYGPYVQSQRQDIYQAYVRKLLEEGKAYPCFMTSEELEAMTKSQNQQKVRPGYHGEWAKWRHLSEDEVVQELDKNKPFVIRFRNPGNVEVRRKVNDAARGLLELPESDNDIVVMKQDGLPTYHLAHVVDDHLMQTTLVTRGDEWLPSTTLHIQLSEALGHQPLDYAHIAPLQKTESGSRRKLSKRKDPEASVSYYTERGYLPETLIEYLMNQANSAFEDWRLGNPDLPYTDFQLTTDNLSKSGALFSIDKLDSIGADQIAKLTADDLLAKLSVWAKEYNPAFHEVISADPAYTAAVLNIERDGDQPRKDMRHLSDAPDLYGYFFDELYENLAVDEKITDRLRQIAAKDQQAVVGQFLKTYDPSDSNDEWFEKVKQVGEPLGFTPKVKDFRKNPDLYKGSVADVAMILRVALTKRNQTPNLHEVMKVMGIDRVKQRLLSFVEHSS